VRLSTASCAGDQDTFTTTKPSEVGEQGELLFGEVSSGAGVDVVHRHSVAKFADTQVQ
jgi:hypothetical protein